MPSLDQAAGDGHLCSPNDALMDKVEHSTSATGDETGGARCYISGCDSLAVAHDERQVDVMAAAQIEPDDHWIVV